MKQKTAFFSFFLSLFFFIKNLREEKKKKILTENFNFWSFKIIKNKKTKATVLDLFCSFIFPKNTFQSISFFF